ncbi:MAG: TlpA family protein disulfide reductase [Chitinophagales bacterium]
MNSRILIVCSLTTFFLCGCGDHSDPKVRISLSAYAADGEKIFLYRMPYLDEKKILIDSAIARPAKDSNIFFIPFEPDRFYQIEIRNTSARIRFIADAPRIAIRFNNVTDKSVVLCSPAMNSLIQLQDQRKKIIVEGNMIKHALDSLTKMHNPDHGKMDSMKVLYSNKFAALLSLELNYGDTVSNPAAFLEAYSNIEFGEENRPKLKAFILRNAQRFPDSRPVQQLKQEVLEMLSIYEQEFQVGDSIPTFSLPDINGREFSTSSLKGKYYLLDFWATWCQTCWPYDRYKKEIRKKFPSSKFELVSVALDDNKPAWASLVKKSGYDWTELIDEKMWRGTAVRTLKFDSIPFNFLVSPEGRILDKAIKPDSLLIILGNTVK